MPLRSIFAGLLAAAQVPEPSPPAGDAAIGWRAPEACPDRGALVRGIETRLGRPLRPGELGVDGVVTVHATPPTYRLALRLRAGGPEERRTLTAATCAALADATAVLAASAVAARAPGSPPVRPESAREPAVQGPVGAAARPRPAAPGASPVSAEPEGAPAPWQVPTAAEAVAPEGPPAPEGAPASSERAPDVPAPAPWVVEAIEVEPPPPPSAPGPALGGFVRVQGGPELGALPGVTGAVGLAAGLLWRRARLEFHGLYLAPRTAVTADGQLRASLAAASAHGCARLGRGRVEVPVCGGLELGGMRGAARDVPEARTTTGWWVAAVAGAGVGVRLGARWSLGAAVQLTAGLARPDFVARDPGPERRLFAPAPVTGRLLVGVELRLGDPR